MAYIANVDASNKADFIFDFSAVDVDTGNDIDLTGAVFSIKISADGCYPIISATLANGLITQPTATIIELRIPATTMAMLTPGSYRMGCVYNINGETDQLLIGNLTVYDGIASL